MGQKGLKTVCMCLSVHADVFTTSITMTRLSMIVMKNAATGQCTNDIFSAVWQSVDVHTANEGEDPHNLSDGKMASQDEPDMAVRLAARLNREREEMRKSEGVGEKATSFLKKIASYKVRRSTP